LDAWGNACLSSGWLRLPHRHLLLCPAALAAWQAATFRAAPERPCVNTDRWYYQVFKGVPDLIRALLPGAAVIPAGLGLDAAEPGDRLYRFAALELKELSHRLDGMQWPRESTGWGKTGSPELPVVVLEVQMQSDAGCHHRLAAQTYRFLQQHPAVRHWAVLVITPQQRLSLEELSRRPRLDPLLNLLTLPVRPEGELAVSSRQILSCRPDLGTVVLPMLIQRFPELNEEEIMVIAGIPREEIRQTRAVQEWLAEGRQEGRREGCQEGRQEGRQEAAAV